jgi:GTPase SAR1 family protein/Leucine-rich repeat (LRR) protein
LQVKTNAPGNDDIELQVRQRLQHAAENPRWPWLDLSNLGLARIPDEVFGLRHLRQIDLSGNRLKDVPARFKDLLYLQELNLVGNPLVSIPDFVDLVDVDVATYRRCRRRANFENARLILDVGVSNEDADFMIDEFREALAFRSIIIGERTLVAGMSREPPSPAMKRVLDAISDLESSPGLNALSIRGIRMDELPPGVGNLTQLGVLDVSGLGLVALPNWIGRMPLSFVLAIDNRLETLPPAIQKMQALKGIDLSWNRFSGVPEVLLEMGGLRMIKLRHCAIREIDAGVLGLPELETLEIDGNPIERPPAEVATKGLGAMRDYLRQLHETGVDYLCEAKLIIIGEPGAGKTSIAKKLLNPDYELRPNEQSTEGIDVLRYEFPTVVRTRDPNGLETVASRNFQANIWDFGGQEIYHATHQFFLTRRSVYLLLCDDRKEDTDFFYWLQAVEMLSDGSPVIIVQNEKQDRRRDINLSGLRGRFSNIKDAVSVNLSTNRGLDAVVRSLKKELEGLPHVGIGLPATWKRVRESLERDARDFINLEEYFSICQVNGFSRREDKLQLSSYLHDLGICLHFQDDPLLKNTVILKPEWGTDAVYRVLDDPDVIEARGRFTRTRLKQLWSDAKYSGMHDELLRMMMKFQLCYEMAGDDAFLAPQLLSSEQPAYAWPAGGGLVLRYDYEFLPKGILARFIVAINHLIADSRLAWKTGVVLERNGSRAEIVEEYSLHRIRVRVIGADARGLLAIVDDQLERLHSSFNRLKYERLLPCPCVECADKAEPYGFRLSMLEKMARKGMQIQCHSSGEMIHAAQLLQDVLPNVLQSADALPVGSSPIRAATIARPEIFISYSWAPESSALADQIQAALAQHDVYIIRDLDEVQYKDSIGDFMKRLGKGKCVIAIISEKYLRSENCMRELIEIFQAQRFRERIFPIVMSDAGIYDPKLRIGYIQHWERQMRDLDEALKTVRSENLVSFQDTLNLYAEIRRTCDRITESLRDMNCLTPEQHAREGYEGLIGRIRAQLLS